MTDRTLSTPLTPLLFVLLLLAGSGLFSTVQAQDEDKPLRIIAFGAHPDDCEINAAGVGALFAAQGHEFKCVSMTNGDIGHFGQSGGALALRRMKEVNACHEHLGTTGEVMDIHDGELMPTLENRRKVANKIREWQADIVMVHRRYDYHADHRYSGVLVDDAIILVEAPFFALDTPPLPKSPVVLYYHDGFERPYPFQPDLVVDIDETADLKVDCLNEMPSQFSDVDSWTYGRSDDIPATEEERLNRRVGNLMARYSAQADDYRNRLVDLYGERRASGVEYAESFELSQYGRQATEEELKALFPTFD